MVSLVSHDLYEFYEMVMVLKCCVWEFHGAMQRWSHVELVFFSGGVKILYNFCV